MKRFANGIYGMLAVISVALVLMVIWSETHAAQIYPPHTQWHENRTLNLGQTVNAFTVPSGVDLTITDIVYDFTCDVGNFQFNGVGGTVTASVWDNGPNLNVTTNNPNPPIFNTNSTVSDSASYQLWFDKFYLFPMTSAQAGNPVRWTIDNDLFTEEPARTLEFKAFAPSTISHHFQTGLFIPEGNDLYLSVGNPGFPNVFGSVRIYLHGRLN